LAIQVDFLFSKKSVHGRWHPLLQGTIDAFQVNCFAHQLKLGTIKIKLLAVIINRIPVKVNLTTFL
jgi:hypothetical protein